MGDRVGAADAREWPRQCSNEVIRSFLVIINSNYPVANIATGHRLLRLEANLRLGMVMSLMSNK